MEKRISALERQLANIIVRLEEGLDVFQGANQAFEQDKRFFNKEVASLRNFVLGEITSLRDVVQSVKSGLDERKEELSELTRIATSNHEFRKELIKMVSDSIKSTSDSIRSFQEDVKKQTSEIELLKAQFSEVEQLGRQNRRLEERLAAIEKEMEKKKTSATMRRAVRRTL